MKNFALLKKSNIANLPKTIGVYCFRKENKFFYIGKAVNIKERVKSHFQKSNPKNALFIKKADKVGYIKTDSEIEALILEAKLIKKYRPEHNIVWRDDKNFFFVGISNDKLPRVFITHQLRTEPKRKINRFSKSKFIGPFVEGKKIKKALGSLRKVFPYYTSKKHPKKLCSWCQLKLCPGDNPDRKAYLKNIKNLVRFLEGKKNSVLGNLKKDMRFSSKKRNYEKAAEIRDQIISLERVLLNVRVLEENKTKGKNWRIIEKKLRKIITSKVKISRIEAYDVSNIQGKEATGSMVTFVEGKPEKDFYRRFKIKKHGKPNDVAMLKEVLLRRLKYLDWKLPELILIDGGKAQLNAGILAKNRKRYTKNIKVISLAKKQNSLYIEKVKDVLFLENLPQEISALILHLRDEAHRFAINYHKKLRVRDLFSKDGQLKKQDN